MASVHKLRKPVGEASVLQAVNTAGVLNNRKNAFPVRYNSATRTS